MHAFFPYLESLDVGTLDRKRLTEVEMKKIIEIQKTKETPSLRLESSIPTITKREGITQSGRWSSLGYTTLLPRMVLTARTVLCLQVAPFLPGSHWFVLHSQTGRTQ